MVDYLKTRRKISGSGGWRRAAAFKRGAVEDRVAKASNPFNESAGLQSERNVA
jgi:hypothetical protein